MNAINDIYVSRRWLPWLLFGLICAFAGLDLVLLLLSWATPVPNIWGFRGDATILALAFGSIGQLLARHRPQNPIGWLFLLAGLISGTCRLGIEYSTYVLLTRPGILPGGVLAAWVASWAWMLMILVILVALMLFPTGRLPSKRWRPVLWVNFGAFGIIIFVLMMRPGPLYFAPYLQNPIAIAGSDHGLRLTNQAASAVALLGMIGMILSIIQRLRQAQGIERQQLKWFSYTAALVSFIGLINVIAGLVLGPPRGMGPKFFQFLTVAVEVAIPISIGLAILRYKLYEIERIINRTLVYVILSSGIVITYVLIVGLLSSMLKTNVNLAAAIMTAGLIAPVFQPLRTRLQHFLDPSLSGTGVAPVEGHEFTQISSTTNLSWRSWLAWLLFGLALVFSLVNLTFLALYGLMSPSLFTQVASSFAALVYAGIGQYIVHKLPQNAIGWLLLWFGFIAPAQLAGREYAAYTQRLHPSALPGGVFMAWIASWMGFLLIWIATCIFFLFPTGRLPSKRWRPIVWATAISYAVFILLQMVKPGPLRSFPGLDNPFGFTSSSTLLSLLNIVSYTSGSLSLVVAAGCVIWRLVVARGVERQQLKWFAFTAALLCIVGTLQSAPGGFNLAVPAWWSLFNLLLPIFIALLPLSIGLAILRYRLYEIDHIINHTLVYGILSAAIIIMYVVLVGALSTLSQTSGNLVISLLATGLIAFLFQPLREQLQRGVNRLMYGERDEPYALIARLGLNLEATNTTDTILTALVRTIAQALKLPYVAIEAGADGYAKTAAAFGKSIGQPQRIPLAYQGEKIGHLLVEPRSPSEPLTTADLNLLRMVAQQAGMALFAVRLTEDLQRSRERLVVAREEERRRIRRDLHDGLGPALASLAMQADNAREWVGTDPARVENVLADITSKAQSSLEDIRRLVYDLRPPSLDELGLIGALRQTVANLPGGLQVEFEAPDPLPRLSAAVEVAVYRITQETLNNVVRHSCAQHCSVKISIQNELLLVISDDGIGLPPDVRAGVGLISMRERAGELGGSCLVESEPGRGTRVTARLPLLERQDESG